MRVVAMADTHLFHDELVVPDGDVLVHAGDACRGGDLAEIARFAAFWKAQPHRTKVFVAGNHDWCFARARAAACALLGADTVYLEDAGCVLGGLRFWGSPWQPAFGPWAFNLPRGPALAARWANIPDALDVLITHGPPRGVRDRTSHGARGDDDGHAGCDDLRARVAVVRPRLHLFGHIHEDGGTLDGGPTLFANVTTDECERAPSVFDVDATGVVAVAVPAPRRG